MGRALFVVRSSMVVIASAVVLSTGVIAAPVSAEEIVEKVQQAIEAAGAEWSAGLTGVSGLSPSERRALCGDPDDPVPEAWKRSLPVLRAPLPAHFDWRDNGGDWTTPIRDQGSCGSCWDFAATAVFEALINIDAGDPALDFDLSEQYVLSCCGDCGSCGGGYSDRALGFYSTTGGVTEPCMPYQADDTVPCEDACTEPHQYLEDYAYIVEDVEAIKSAIYHYGPVCASFEVYDDFFSYTGGIYEHVFGDYCGGHAISVVGWDDTHQYWICKNSWDTDWGEAGWFNIRWGQCDIEGRRVVAATMDPWPGGYVAVSVLDGSGVGIDGAEIYVNGEYYGDTGAGGALMLGLIEGMYYNVQAYSYGKFLLFDSVAAPGTLIFDCRDASYVTVSGTTRLGDPLNGDLVFLPNPYEYRYPCEISSGSGAFYITPGVYDYQLWADDWGNGDHYNLAFREVDLTASTGLTIDCTSIPLMERRLDILADSSAGPYEFLWMAARPSGFDGARSVSVELGESLLLNEGDWLADLVLREGASSSYTWDYATDYVDVVVAGAGLVSIEAGGELVHTTSSGAPCYPRDSTVEVRTDLTDAFGLSFRYAARYDPAAAPPPTGEGGPHLVADASGDVWDGGAWAYFEPRLTVTPPTDPAIFDDEVRLQDWNNVPIGQSAELGMYTVRSTIDTHLGTLEGVSSFEVQDVIGSKMWTIMVYLAADNNLGGGTPSDPDFMDFDEIETALLSSGSALNVVVLWDLPGTNDSYIYWVQPDGTEGSLATYTVGVNKWAPPWGNEVNMGAQSNLTSFLDWTFANFASDYWGLILWNHGGGWAPKSKTYGDSDAISSTYVALEDELTDILLEGNDAIRPLLQLEKDTPQAPLPRAMMAPGPDGGVCWDDTDGDYLTTKEAAYGIENSTRSWVHNLGLDACLMQMLEVAYEFYDTPTVAADYLTASEASEWGYGWAYHEILSAITTSTTPLQLAQLWGTTRSTRHASVGLDTISSVALWEVGDLAADVSALADRLTTLLATSSEYHHILYAKLLAEWFPYTSSSYVDVGDFCERLAMFLGDATASSLAQAVTTQLSSTVIAMSNGTAFSLFGSATGLSIYLPHEHDVRWDSTGGGPSLSQYNGTNLAFCADHTWDEFVTAWLAADHVDPHESNDSPAAAYDRGTAYDEDVIYLFREADFDDGTADWYKMTIPFWFDLDAWVWCTEYSSDTVLYAYDSLANAQADNYFATDDDGMRSLGYYSLGSRIQESNCRPGTYYFEVVPYGVSYGIDKDYEIWLRITRGANSPATFRVDSEGYVYLDGTLRSNALETGFADVAEWVNVSGPVQAGDVLELDPLHPGQYRVARGGCSPNVAGVVSTEPGLILGGETTGQKALLALAGFVPVKACDEGGPIRVGDLVVMASRAGHVKRWNQEEGCGFIIGKALEPLKETAGSILILLAK